MAFDEVVEAALQLSDFEKARLMERLAASMQDALQSEAAEETAWADEELAALKQVTPMTGAEIVAAGLVGSWQDLGIKDGAEWVNDKKRQRKARNQW